LRFSDPNFPTIQYGCVFVDIQNNCPPDNDCFAYYEDRFVDHRCNEATDPLPGCTGVCGPVGQVADTTNVASTFTPAQVTGIAVGGSVAGLLLLLVVVLFFVRRGEKNARKDKPLLQERSAISSTEDS